MTELLPRDQVFISKLTEIIITNLGNENFDVKELASQSGLSHYSLSRKFYAITNKTAREFIRETRLLKALEMLRNEEFTVAEVAYKVGFSSPSYFNTCFHEFFGYSPGKVKKAEFSPPGERSTYPKAGTGRQQLFPGSARRIYIISAGIVFSVFLAYLGYNYLRKDSTQTSGVLMKGHEKSIAVMPFINLSDSSANQYFIDGVMEEILANLSRIHDLRVISRTSVEQFRKNTKSAAEIGKKLNVDYLVEGSGQKYGNKLVLRVQLIAVNNERHLWAKSYAQEISEASDIIRIQSQVAQSIASELQATITPLEKQFIEKIPTKSLIAHDFFIRGQQALDSATNRDAIRRAGHLYRSALKYDSAFARVYIGLANVYWVKIDQERNFAGNDVLNRYIDSMLVLTNIAISLDDQLAEAYYVRGGCYYNKGNEEQALEEWDKAIKYNPNDYSSYWCKGCFYESHDLIKAIDNSIKAALLNHGPRLPEILTRIGSDFYMAGFPEKGKEYLLEALKIDEDSIKYLDNYYCCLAENQGEYQKAVQHFEKRSQADSTNDLLLIRLGFYNLLIGNHKESLKYFKKYDNWVKIKQQTTSMDRRNMEYGIGYINLQNGFRKEADIYLDKSIDDYTRFIKSAPEHEKRIYIYRLAGLYSCRGDKHKAYENLKLLQNEQCFSLKDLILIKNDPLFNSMRNEQDFQQIVKDMESNYQAEHERVRIWMEEQGML